MYAYNMSITKSSFVKNSAKDLSKNIFIGFSDLSIDQTTFEDELFNEGMDDPKTLGSFLHLIMSVNLNISNSAFINGYS